MKIVGISDLHGYLPQIPECDVLCICGDILPLDIQRNYIKSIVWISREFTQWIKSIPCEKVLLIAGNHDFVFQKIVNNCKGNSRIDCGDRYWEAYAPTLISDELCFYDIINDKTKDEKLIYLQDSEYTYKGIHFYGTPWCPDLKQWAFYKDSKDLTKKFGEISMNTDVLLTHTPGAEMFDTEASHFDDGEVRYFGSSELSAAVLANPNIKLWMCGHIHSGNHNLSETGTGMKVVNVSLIDEQYKPAYKPFEIEL